MEKQIEDEINLVLADCHKNGMISINDNTSNIRVKAIQDARTLGLIQPKGPRTYELTNKGLKVLDFDGRVREYLRNIAFKEIKDDLIGNIF